MKKFISLVIISMLSLTLVSCKSTISGKKYSAPFKVGIATNQYGETWETFKKYLDNEVADALSMQFYYSDHLSDADGLVAFMNDAYAQGCVGILNLITTNEAVTRGVALAEEYGMYFVTENSSFSSSVMNSPYNMGHCGASSYGIGAAYNTVTKGLVDDGGEHGFYIFSGGAAGSIAASHYYTTAGILEGLQEVYGLTYQMSIDDLVNNTEPGVVEHDNPNIKIYLYPGIEFPPTQSVVKAKEILSEDGYDTLVTVYGTSSFLEIVDEVEKEKHKNIRILCTSSMEPLTAEGFSTYDSTGDTVLNAVIINPLSVQTAMCLVLLYHGMNGNRSAMVDENGNAILFHCLPWEITSQELYRSAESLDLDHASYVLNSDDLRALIDEEITYRDIEAKLKELGDINTVIETKLGY